uniref:Uncharacterized protein n=1 Tax=Anguilla anguilla TaxID=7936 RepID=A0A0E9SR84_ANGAN
MESRSRVGQQSPISCYKRNCSLEWRFRFIRISN